MEEEVERQPQLQKPRMKWVYNSDYSDPVNFGFMFLVPDDGSDHVSDASSAVPSTTTERPPSNTFTAPAYPRTPQIASSSSSSVSPTAAPDFVNEGSYLSILNKSRSITPDASQQINPHANFFTNPNYQPGNDYIRPQTTSHSPVSYPPSSSSYSAASPQQLPYRPSPQFVSSNLPPQQLTPNENTSW